MSAPYELPMPPDYDLDDTYQIRVTALNPSTGAVVAGVKVGAVTFMVDRIAGSGDLDVGFGPFMLVPGPGA